MLLKKMIVKFYFIVRL